MTQSHPATRAVSALTRRRHTPPGTPGAAEPSLPARAAGLLRRHWLVSVLLAAGLVLRVLAQAAYHPALIYVDTLKYLYGASPGSEPLGYTVVLKAVLAAGDLGTVTAVQHLLGLAMAVALYAVLLRRGVARWLAALAAAPVLLDAYQLQMEQTIMPDVWFEALVVAGLAVLLWRHEVPVRFAVTAGLILGVSATFKQLGEVLVVPAVIYLLLAGERARARVLTSAALCAAFLLPVLGYCSVSAIRTGHFWLAHQQSHTGRLVAAADCATLKLPPAVRPLCPAPREQALGPDWLEHSNKSPLYAAPIPPSTPRLKLIGQLDSAIVSQQAPRVLVSIASDWLRLFSWTRSSPGWVTPIARWQFQTSYPTYPPWTGLGPGNVIMVGVQYQAFKQFYDSPLRPAYGGPAQVDRPLAAFLRGYQLHGGYTPGPLLALLTLAGVAGSLLLASRRGRAARTRPLALASLLFTVTSAAVLMVPDMLEFSWRYQLPAVVTLVPAGAAGLAALASLRGEPRARPRKHLLRWARFRPQPGGDAPDQA